MLRLLRLLRILRIQKMTKVFSVVPALWRLLSGLVGAFEALAWGSLLTLVLMLLWSIVAVELIHPVAWKVHVDDRFCREAFSSVPKVTFYFFLTLIAGDEWGRCSVPVIEESPSLLLVFGGALVTIQIGFLNLVLAVIVDGAAEAREAAMKDRDEEQKAAEKDSLARLSQVWTAMDSDKSGELSEEELLKAYSEIPDVKSMMNKLGIFQSDLKVLFRVLDKDDSGKLMPTEFIQALQRAQTQDARVRDMTMQLRLQKVQAMIERHHPMRAPVATCGAPATATPSASGGVTDGVIVQMRTFLEDLDLRFRRVGARVVKARAAEATAAQTRAVGELADAIVRAVEGPKPSAGGAEEPLARALCSACGSGGGRPNRQEFASAAGQVLPGSNETAKARLQDEFDDGMRFCL
mmetsp:Transcript_88084/g.254214  ORF Transcript_88084/g.254214 Transcript_88084/m.254214 type:complete len:407 (-) Transcript_88084:318-1538(-)